MPTADDKDCKHFSIYAKIKQDVIDKAIDHWQVYKARGLAFVTKDNTFNSY